MKLILALAFVLSTSAFAETIIKRTDVLGGVVKNRRTGDVLGIRCAGAEPTDCSSINILLMQEKGDAEFIVMNRINNRFATLASLETLADEVSDTFKSAYDDKKPEFLPDGFYDPYFYNGMGYWLEKDYFLGMDVGEWYGAVPYILATPVVATVDTAATATINALLLTRLLILEAKHAGIDYPRMKHAIKRSGKAIRHMMRAKAGDNMTVSNLVFTTIRSGIR